MKVELPKNACISCAYLCESGTVVIPRLYREKALNGKTWNSGQINYERIVCHMGKQDFSEYNINNQVIDIRNEAIRVNKCKDWTRFTGIAPIAMEQRKSECLPL